MGSQPSGKPNDVYIPAIVNTKLVKILYTLVRITLFER